MKEQKEINGSENENENTIAAEENFLNSKSYAYHLATKHSLKSLYSSNHRLDWATQPDPFRIYKGSSVVELPREFYDNDFNVFEILRFDSPAQSSKSFSQWNTTPPKTISPDLKLLSSILYHSMALSAWKQVVGTDHKWSLRVNPSSGNLHPTETHILVSNVAGISDGAYHYSVKDHMLEKRFSGKAIERIWQVLGRSDNEQPSIIIALTSIFWREAWKYRDRAFRYCQLDLGHAAAAINLAAASYGYQIKIVSEFPDNAIANAIGLADSDEKPMLLLCLYPAQNADQYTYSNTESDFTQALENPALTKGVAAANFDAELFKGTPNLLSSAEIAYKSIADVYEASCLTQEQYLRRREQKIEIVNRRANLFEAAEIFSSADNSSSADADKLISLADSALSLNELPCALEIVRKRRSAVNMSPAFQTSMARMSRILSASTETCSGFFAKLTDSQCHSVPYFIFPLLFVNKVTGIAPGVYTLDRRKQTICLLEEGDVRANAKFVSCLQEIASDGVLAVSLIADLSRAFDLFGDRGYRYVYQEAGYIGQLFYITAKSLGIDATGIGCFLDDEINQSLPPGMEAVYNFTFGKAVHDPRLTDLAAYDFAK
jgi:SagB-type dehydrogenase family enzyme